MKNPKATSWVWHVECNDSRGWKEQSETIKKRVEELLKKGQSAEMFEKEAGGLDKEFVVGRGRLSGGGGQSASRSSKQYK